METIEEDTLNTDEGHLQCLLLCKVCLEHDEVHDNLATPVDMKLDTRSRSGQELIETDST